MSALDHLTDPALEDAARGVVALIGMLKEAGIDAMNHQAMTQQMWEGLQELVFSVEDLMQVCCPRTPGRIIGVPRNAPDLEAAGRN